jgi:hypothetical protein
MSIANYLSAFHSTSAMGERVEVVITAIGVVPGRQSPRASPETDLRFFFLNQGGRVEFVYRITHGRDQVLRSHEAATSLS